MHNKAAGMVLGSFLGDALSLPVHWIYDTEQIDREYGIVDRLLSPEQNRYHLRAAKGGFTHYGEQAMVLLTHLAETGEFNLAAYSGDWQNHIELTDAYRDKASSHTLAALSEGVSETDCGSPSSDLGGPARLAPLIYRYRNDKALLEQKAREIVSFTHRGAGISAGTDFLVQTTLDVLDGMSPTRAIEKAMDNGISDLDLDMRLAASLDTVPSNSRDTVKAFGQACGIASALPGAVHLILSYEMDFTEAMVQNVMAGGDSAARGMAVGMVLGAHHGVDGLNDGWLAELAAYREILNKLDMIDGQKAGSGF
jgi:ADP-ribosylglycohydrolase